MTTLTELFDAIGTAVNAKRVGSTPVSFKVGASEIPKLKAPPNVVFVPLESKGAPAKTVGHVTRNDDGDFVAAENEPEALWFRKLLIGCHVYGRDIDDCSVLAEQLIEAVHDNIAGHYVFEGERWDTAGEASKGMVLELFFRIDARWNRPLPTIVVPTSMPVIGTLEASV
jgi:hypothetical protein